MLAVVKLVLKYLNMSLHLHLLLKIINPNYFIWINLVYFSQFVRKQAAQRQGLQTLLDFTAFKLNLPANDFLLS